MNFRSVSLLLLSFLAPAAIGCSGSSSVEKNSETPDSPEAQTQEPPAEVSDLFHDDLSLFTSVLDTLDSSDDRLVNSSYFIFDITGDGTPELWIKTGSCEADYRLMAFTADSGNPRKIYDGDGGHSDFFFFDGQLVNVMCNTGAGFVITYSYDGERVTESKEEFSIWNDERAPLSASHDPKTDEKLGYWEENFGNFIKLKPL